MEDTKKMHLVLGAGFLSQQIVKCSSEVETISVNRSGEGVTIGEKEQLVKADILEEESLREVKQRMPGFNGHVFFLIPPSGFGEESVASVLKGLFSVLSVGRIRGVVLVSSTGVFSESKWSTISKSSDILGVNSRVKRLLEIENAWLSSPFKVVVARLGGLYGVDRVIGKGMLLSGKSFLGTGKEYLNLIHAYDAASAILKLTQNQFVGKKFNVTDNNPPTRRAYYKYLAEKLGVEPPTFNGNPRHSYLCDSRLTWDLLGIEPLFGDYRQGLDKLFE